MQRLSGLDTAFVALETPTNHMHVMAGVVLDPATAPGEFSFSTVRAHVEERLHLLPPFRRRLVQVPFGVNNPVWIEDPEFELDTFCREKSERKVRLAKT